MIDDTLLKAVLEWDLLSGLVSLWDKGELFQEESATTSSPSKMNSTLLRNKGTMFFKTFFLLNLKKSVCFKRILNGSLFIGTNSMSFPQGKPI